MPSALTCRCTIGCKTDKTMYDTFIEEGQALADTNLGAHEINHTFFPAQPDSKGNIHYEKIDGTPFVTNFIAEIGSKAQGPWMAAYPKNPPPGFKLSHKMVLALHCPTGAPEPLRTMYRDGVAVCDSICAHDEEQEGQKGENFEITEWISCAKGDENTVDKMILLAQLPRLTRFLTENHKGWIYDKPGPDFHDVTDVDLEATQVAEHKVSDHYPPDQLPNNKGPYFAHEKAKLIERDYKDVDGTLIAPHELYSKLTEGTLVLLTVSLVMYVIKSKKGELKPDRKVYHVLVNRLKILDHGDSEAWDPPVLALPERCYSPATPKRGRDDTADAAFDSFGSKSLPSLAKKSRCTAGK
ncbi:hypothetical protein B0H10DRAFT_2360976 [Mycena sp. CBHHK59/15]|nr:hypothetical protein B0H10DRAFT_2360976 [Mycena sp. CBHHK59/15]